MMAKRMDALNRKAPTTDQGNGVSEQNELLNIIIFCPILLSVDSALAQALIGKAKQIAYSLRNVEGAHAS